MNIYCANYNCGKKTEYLISKPSFCQFCGEPFDAAFKRPIQKETVAKAYSYNDDNDWETEAPIKFKKLSKSLAQVTMATKATVKDLIEGGVSFDRNSQPIMQNGGGVESDFDPRAQLNELVQQRKARK